MGHRYQFAITGNEDDTNGEGGSGEKVGVKRRERRERKKERKKVERNKKNKRMAIIREQERKSISSASKCLECYPEVTTLSSDYPTISFFLFRS